MEQQEHEVQQKIEEVTVNPEMLTPLIEALRKEQEASRKEREKVKELEAKLEYNKRNIASDRYVQDTFNNHETVIFDHFTSNESQLSQVGFGYKKFAITRKNH